MRLAKVTGVCAAFFIACFSPLPASAAQYVQITEPFVNVYEKLDPKSSVIKTAAKGERFDLVFAGDKWYKVKVKGQEGWVELKAGRVVEGASVVSIIVTVVLLLALVGGTAYVVISYIKKQQTA